MVETRDLAKMLQEIAEDEKVGALKKKKLSQEEIKRVVAGKWQKSKPKPSRIKDGPALDEETELQEQGKGPNELRPLLEFLVSMEGSDLFLVSGLQPSIKVNNTLVRSPLPALTHEQCVGFATTLMDQRRWAYFDERKDQDFAVSYDNLGRFRVNAYRQRGMISLAIRRIPEDIPSLEALGLPPFLEELALKPQGLIVFTAPAGHGKTTSLNALVNVINAGRSCNIITLEDPVEYVHVSLKSNINQREIGIDVDSFSEGLRRIFRQAPDVIVVGELRDSETIRDAINAASTGHMVLSTMHASNATSAIDNLVNRFSESIRGQIRQQLADSLLSIFSQRLLPGVKGRLRVLAYEMIINSPRIRKFILENKVHRIRTRTQKESEDFSSLDDHLVTLLEEGAITLQTALPYAEDAKFVANFGMAQEAGKNDLGGAVRR